MQKEMMIGNTHIIIDDFMLQGCDSGAESPYHAAGIQYRIPGADCTGGKEET